MWGTVIVWLCFFGYFVSILHLSIMPIRLFPSLHRSYHSHLQLLHSPHLSLPVNRPTCTSFLLVSPSSFVHLSVLYLCHVPSSLWFSVLSGFLPGGPEISKFLHYKPFCYISSVLLIRTWILAVTSRPAPHVMLSASFILALLPVWPYIPCLSVVSDESLPALLFLCLVLLCLVLLTLMFFPHYHPPPHCASLSKYLCV